ncbi:MAG: peptidoglycan hydrolase-like protein with peptidoglycan-binding domain [Verrucomicrobiales bacterium]|jgi:peptidoglycan hydrolase-like protein with peptidoglycan-binding domain
MASTQHTLHAHRSRLPALLVGLALGAAAGAGTLWYLTRDTPTTTGAETQQAQTVPVVAEARDLVSYEEWAGTLTSGTPGTVAASARGTITRTAEIGDMIEAGEVLAEIDGAPVVALYGSVPQFREIAEDIDSGADIRQLEENLVALGFDPDGTVTVDEEFTYNTGLMVARWEESLGFAEADSVVDAGQVAFITGPSEVISTSAVGSQAVQGQPLIMTVTLAESGFIALPISITAIETLVVEGMLIDQSTALANLTTNDDLSHSLIATNSEPNAAATVEGRTEVVVPAGAVIVDVVLDQDTSVEAGRPIYRWEIAQGAIELEVDVDNIDTFELALAVVVELPDGAVINARVETISDVARTVQAGQQSATVLDVTVAPDEPLDGRFTSGPVIIRTKDTSILQATVVPVRALIALAEGGHAIEVDGRGLVAVELGTFDEGWVEITNGAVNPGDTVLAPA